MADEIVLYLSENWTAVQIAAARDKVFAAHLAGLKEESVVSATTFEGTSSSFTISASPQERERFLRQCREALAIKSGGSIGPAHGVKLDFSTRVTST